MELYSKQVYFQKLPNISFAAATSFWMLVFGLKLNIFEPITPHGLNIETILKS